MEKNKEIHIDFQENGKDYLMHECSKAFLITFSDTSGLCTNTEPVCVCLDKKTAEKYLKLHKGFRSIQELPLVTVSAKTKRKKTKGNKDLDLNKLYEMQKENREIMENLKQVTETPMFGNNDNFAQAITEAGIKAAKATHEFNMMEIKAKMLADLCNNIIACVPHSVNPQHPEFVTDYANKLLEQTVCKL